LNNVISILESEKREDIENYIADAFRHYGVEHGYEQLHNQLSEARAYALGGQQDQFEVDIEWINMKYPLINRYMAELATRQLREIMKK